MKTTNREWMCRNCNSLIDETLNTCPHCHAERPTESLSEPTPEGIAESVIVENYANATPRPAAKHNFREAVLINAADIVLVIGLFCTFGALIAPMFIDNIEHIELKTICLAVVIFAFAMVQWALLRTVADISRRLREYDEKR